MKPAAGPAPRTPPPHFLPQLPACQSRSLRLPPDQLSHECSCSHPQIHLLVSLRLTAMYCLMFMYCLQLPKDMMGGRLVILAERQDKSIASVSGGVLQGGLSSMVCLYGFTAEVTVVYGVHRARVEKRHYGLLTWRP